MAAIRNYFFPVNEVTGHREFHLIPSSLEKFVGQNSYAPLIEKSGGEIEETDRQYGRYVTLVKEVGAELAALAKRKDLEFEFKVIDSQVDNAWCLPGGKIGINIGLILNMDKAELTECNNAFSLRKKIAAVLSHEIVHADARHTGRSLEFRLFLIGIIKATQLFVVYHWVHRSYHAKIKEARDLDDQSRVQALRVERESQAKRIGNIFEATSSWLIRGISLCNSRSHELESDRFGMRMLWNLSKIKPSIYDHNSPQSAMWLQHYFKEHHSHDTQSNFLNRALNLFSSHPTPEERLAANLETWGDLYEGRL